jgi:hypothetical protein
MGSITVCPVHIFPPPAELLVCYQPHRQEVMPGQKPIYETFLLRIYNATLIYRTTSNHGYSIKLSLAKIQVKRCMENGNALN